MKKLLLLLTMPVLLFSCSKEESTNGLGTEVETKTITPAVGYESPYDLNSINPTFPIKFVNNTTYPVNYRLATIVGFYDGNWDGVIDYTSFGGPLLTSVNAPILLGGGSEFGYNAWVQSLFSPPASVINTDINSLPFNSAPYNALELGFLKTYSKLLHVDAMIGGQSFMLKHDVPPPFTNMNSIPGIMSSNGYDVIPGVNAYNPVLNLGMGVSVFHNSSREIIWPDMPNYRSEYFFTEPGGTGTLHLYFKTYSEYIEIVLE